MNNTPKLKLDPQKMQYVKTGMIVLGFVAFTAAGYFLFGGAGGSLFQASLVGSGTPKPFDGTVYPVQKTANWVKLTSAEYSNFKSGAFTYDEATKAGKMIDIPTYNAEVLKNDPAKLTWKGADLDIRNTLLTYVTAFGGAYTSGSAPAIENVGSHPAVDIRAPKGTPVFAIANGKVTKVKSDKSDGNLAVIEHADVPSVENPNTQTTYYSSYLHLDTLMVSEGQVVTKGQQIGTVGTTGISTTYHLHFQLDKKDAPFHPYWPFTFAEAKSAGLDFVTGVDKGLNKERVQQYTTNPFQWIHINKNFSGATSPTETSSGSTSAPTNTNTTPAQAGVAKLTKMVLLPSNTSVTAGSEVAFTLSMYDETEKLMESFAPTTPVQVSVSAGAKGTLSTKTVESFSKGTATFSYKTVDIERVQVTVTSGSVSVSGDILVTDRIKNPVKFSVQYSTVSMVGEPLSVSITAVDENNQKTVAGITDAILISAEGGEGSFSKNILSFQDFVDGVARVNFTPAKAGNYTITVVSGSLAGNGPVVQVAEKGGSSTSTFRDVTPTSPHGKAILYLQSKGIIEGYNDGTFRPENPINRAEGTKVILASLGESPEALLANTSFKDTQPSDWFSGWVELGKTLGVLAGNPDGTFTPARQVNLAESLKIILLANKVDLSNEVVFEKPFADVETDSWFAPYFQYAKKKNLIEADAQGNIAAGKTLTRGEVAEIMYRLLRIQETNAQSYSSAIDA